MECKINDKNDMIGKNDKNKMQGFTLVEILIVLFMFGLILAALFTMFIWHAKIYDFQQAMVRTSGSSRAALQTLDSYGRQAYRVLASRDFNGTTYSSGPSVLVLQLPAYNGSGEALPGKWDYAVFYSDGSKFYQIVETDASSSRKPATKQLSDTLASIQFSYDNGDFTQVRQVSVDFQAQQQAREQLVTARLQQNIYLRNY